MKKYISALIATLLTATAFAQSNITIYGTACDPQISRVAKSDTKEASAATGAKADLIEMKVNADASKAKTKALTDEVKTETAAVAPIIKK